MTPGRWAGQKHCASTFTDGRNSNRLFSLWHAVLVVPAFACVQLLCDICWGHFVSSHSSWSPDWKHWMLRGFYPRVEFLILGVWVILTPSWNSWSLDLCGNRVDFSGEMEAGKLWDLSLSPRFPGKSEVFLGSFVYVFDNKQKHFKTYFLHKTSKIFFFWHRLNNIIIWQQMCP